ncbi:NACHT domain-containing protein [Bacillus cereus]|uniref:NACHT domain-containing protein n=1 Tax=Bacillus cereus TaxID=1396 RepID=UPI0010BEC8D9|nr:NACHT domain-containing protein [Bacillus cereus]TKH85950.1 NACHT domain-containing protein [Bacillus cereus]
MALNAAHRGYVYQDLVTACFLVQSIIHNYDSIVVDKKLFEGDSLDDLTFFKNNKSERRQFKYSKDRILKLDDLKKEKGSINLVHIIKSHLEFDFNGEKEYRLCLAWDEPLDKEMKDLLELTKSEPSLEILNTKCYKIKADKLWPENQAPIWNGIAEVDISRDEFLKMCEILIIELDWPKASLDLTNSGVLEQYLVNILEDQIGVGKYPNEDRNAIDVAATLIRLANICRAESRTITPKEIIKQLGLRTDFGKVSQKNIVDLKRYVNRNDIFEEFKSCIEGRYTVLIGTPGSGKSWLLSMLYEELKNEHLVARHYCYLEPGDQDMQRRITSNALFGNLISDLISSEESLMLSKESIFSADENELNKILEQAAHRQKIYLIIDGLDHISRVFNSVTDLSKGEIDIIEKLIMLKIPENVHIILGSQPGKHLDPISKLEGVNYYETRNWESENIEELFTKYELKEKIETLVDSNEEFYSRLKEKTEGNPLYITFLIKRLLIDIEKEVIDIEKFLNNFPKIEGDIRNYYEYLIQSTEDSGTIVIGEILALVDFGLTERELKEIFPYYARLVPKALDLLAPILINVSVQGGVRVYHESFRRYINEKLEEGGISVHQIITPVIIWLKEKNFFLDSKAYQFLLSMLRRAKLFDEIEKIVNKEFIVNSIAYCHPKKAVEQNLIIASNVAKTSNDFVFQVRINELKKSLYTAYEEKLGEIRLYAETFALLYGYEVLAQRLILDGHITFEIESGLILCDIIDKNGEVAPWKEYCEAYRHLEKRDTVESALAFFRGALRIGNWEEKKKFLLEWFEKQNEKSNYLYIKGIIKILLDFEMNDFVYSLLDIELYEKVKDTVRFELIQFLIDKDKDKAKQLMIDTVSHTFSEDVALLCLKLEEDICFEELNIEQPKDIELYIDSHIADALNVSKWTKSIRLYAARKYEDLLNEELARVSGEGWYKKWLRFIIRMAEIEAERIPSNDEKEKLILSAFRLMENEVSPFSGKPRACDLYSIEDIIFTSFKEAMQSVVSEEGWLELTFILENISKKTTTYLMGSPGGPLPSSRLIGLLNLYTNQENAKKAIGESIKRLTNRASNNGEYFEIQAEHEMYYSMIMKKLGNEEEAFSSWEKVCRYLASYGFHKDVTIYELLNGAEHFIGVSDDWIKEKLFEILPLLNKVIVHTDKREVRYIHNDWFKLLVKVDFSSAIKLLSRSIKVDGGRIDWRLDDALETILESSDTIIPPDIFVVAVLSSSISFNNNLVRKLLNAVKLISESEPSKAKHFYDLIKSKIFETDLEEEVVNILSDYEHLKDALVERETYDENNEPEQLYKKYSVCISSATPLEIISYIRELKKEELCCDQFINAIGFKLLVYLESERNSEVLKMIDLLAEKFRFSPKELMYTFQSLMEGFERHKFYEPAIYLAILQFTRVYGDGWKAFGGTKMIPKIKEFYESHQTIVEKFLQNEIMHYLEKETPSFGMTSNMIYLFKYINLEISKKLWEEAFEIIDLRLKTEKNFLGPFIKFEEKEIKNENENVANVIELIFSRMTHPELKRKSWALWGVFYFYFTYESDFLKALKEFIKTDIYESMLEVILCILLEKEIPSHIKDVEWPTYFKETSYYSIQNLTKQILDFENPIIINTTIKEDLKEVDRIDLSILSLDKKQAAIRMEEYLPKIIENVCYSFAEIFDTNKAFLKEIRDMYSAFRGQKDRVLPEVDYWDRGNEFYKQVLNEKVFDYSITHPLILTYLINDLRIPATMKASKIRKPTNTILELDSLIPQTTKLDGYMDWIRIASIQNEVILEDKDHSYSRNMKYIREIYQGIVFSNIEEMNYEHFPLEEDEELDWWYLDETLKLNFKENHPQNLVAYSKVYTDFGTYQILKLKDAIINALNLKIAEFPEPFNLVDQSNKLAVVYRNWEYDLIGSELSEETYRLSGYELIMRPDIYAELLRKCNGYVYQVIEEYNI